MISVYLLLDFSQPKPSTRHPVAHKPWNNGPLRKNYHVVRKKNHVVRKLFYVASIWGYS